MWTKKYKSSIIGGLLSAFFIILTGFFASSPQFSGIFDIAFVFHLIPFVIGFSGVSSLLIILYYLIFWLVFTLIFSSIYNYFLNSKSKLKIILLVLLGFGILFSFIAYYNYTTSKQIDEYLSTYNVEKEKELKEYESLKSGDVIFQISQSNQSIAIQKATNSKYSHVGIVYVNQEDYYVFEASNVVKKTPLKQWINQGKDNHYVIKRLINADSLISIEEIIDLRIEAEKYLDKSYDLHFDWSDEKMYCSELVWKIYKKVLNIEIGELEQMKDFDLTSPEVKKILEKRYGNDIPLNDTVISPVSIFNSKNLMTIIEN